jgi:hypothetical protein
MIANLSPQHWTRFFACTRADGEIEIGIDWNGAEESDQVLFRSYKNQLQAVLRPTGNHGS